MKNWVKITLYSLLVLAIIAVVRLMLGKTRQTPENPTEIQVPIEENIVENTETKIETDTFEEDVMRDLEWFFGNSNGYEDIEWEYWFTNPENE